MESLMLREHSSKELTFRLEAIPRSRREIIESFILFSCNSLMKDSTCELLQIHKDSISPGMRFQEKEVDDRNRACLRLAKEDKSWILSFLYHLAIESSGSFHPVIAQSRMGNHLRSNQGPIHRAYTPTSGSLPKDLGFYSLSPLTNRRIHIHEAVERTLQLVYGYGGGTYIPWAKRNPTAINLFLTYTPFPLSSSLKEKKRKIHALQGDS